MTMLTRRAVLATTASLAAPAILRAQPAAANTRHPAARLPAPWPKTAIWAAPGAQIAIDEINNGGGIKGLGGAKIENRVRRRAIHPRWRRGASGAACSPTGSLPIVGGYASPICLAASQAASRYGLPYVVDVGVADSIVSRGLTNTFPLRPGLRQGVQHGAGEPGHAERRSGQTGQDGGAGA